MADYNRLSIKSLKTIIRENKTKTTPKYSKLKKAELIQLILKHFPEDKPTAEELEPGEILEPSTTSDCCDFNTTKMTC